MIEPPSLSLCISLQRKKFMCRTSIIKIYSAIPSFCFELNIYVFKNVTLTLYSILFSLTLQLKSKISCAERQS